MYRDTDIWDPMVEAMVESGVCSKAQGEKMLLAIEARMTNRYWQEQDRQKALKKRYDERPWHRKLLALPPK